MPNTSTEIFSGTITDTISALLGGLTVAFDKFTKWGIELGKVQEEKGVTRVPLKLKDGEVFYVKYKYTNSDKTEMKIMVEDESGNQVKRHKVKINTPEDYMKVVMEMLSEGWNITKEDLIGDNSNNTDTDDETNEQENGDDFMGTKDIVKNSRTLKATLQRVCGGTEGDTLNLLRVCGSYNPEEMSADLEAVLESPDVTDIIGEEPVSLSIVDTGDDFEVNECNLSDAECLSQACTTILTCAYHCLHDLQAIHWNAKGDKFDEIHRSSDNFIWSVRNKIDQVAELAVQLTGHVAHPAVLIGCVDSSLDTRSGFEGDKALKMIYDEIMTFKCCLELHICNFTDDVQNMMNMWIREYSHEADYLLNRRLSGNTSTVCVNPPICNC